MAQLPYYLYHAPWFVSSNLEQPRSPSLTLLGPLHVYNTTCRQVSVTRINNHRAIFSTVFATEPSLILTVSPNATLGSLWKPGECTKENIVVFQHCESLIELLRVHSPLNHRVHFCSFTAVVSYRELASFL